MHIVASHQKRPWAKKNLEVAPLDDNAGQDGLAMCNKGLSFTRGNDMLANQVWERDVGRVDI